MVNTSIIVILRIFFLLFRNVDGKFAQKLEKLIERFYIATETLFTTSLVQIIDKKELTKAAMDKNSETFIIHILVL